MKVYNQEKTQVLTEYDLEKGHLESDTITMPEIPAVEEQSHIEVIAEYPNGGKEVKKVIDVVGQAYKPKHEEEIAVYIPYTEEELQKFANEREIQECLQYLQDTDYITNKLAEAEAEYIATGDNTEVLALREHYAEELATRKNKRARIQELEKLLQQE